MRRLLLAALLGGCSLGESSAVQEVDPDLLAGLDEPTTPATTSAPPTVPETVETTTTTPAGAPPSSTATSLAGTTTTVPSEPMVAYFIEGTQLLPTTVDVPEGASLRRRLRVLEDGPPDEVAGSGVRTALPVDLIDGIELRPGGATVHLDGNLFAGIDASDQRLLIGQIVLTLTEQSGLEAVDFTLDGDPVPVYRKDTTLTGPGETVGRDDYEVLLVGVGDRAPGETVSTP